MLVKNMMVDIIMEETQESVARRYGSKSLDIEDNVQSIFNRLADLGIIDIEIEELYRCVIKLRYKVEKIYEIVDHYSLEIFDFLDRTRVDWDIASVPKEEVYED